MSPKHLTELAKVGNGTIPVIQIVVTTTEGELKGSGALEFISGH